MFSKVTVLSLYREVTPFPTHSMEWFQHYVLKCIVLLFVAARPYNVLEPIPALPFDPLEAFPSEALQTFSECLEGDAVLR